MTTRSGLRTLVRNQLNDNAAVKLWADADLNQWLGEAITEYSYLLPKGVQTTIVSVANQTDYALPSDFLRFARVAQPKSQLRQPSPITEYSYRVFGSELILDPAPGSTGGDNDIYIEYWARYALPSADGDVLATPTQDDAILVHLVCAKALAWVDTDEAKRQRFERQRGVTVRSLAQSYQDAAQGEIANRKRAVRFGQLTQA
jgi:hypothetical protein